MYETITVWKWRDDPTKIIIWKGPIFPGSESFAAKWEPVFTFKAINPLIRPLPKGYFMYVARRADSFPYNTVELQRIDNLFYPKEKGLYYTAAPEHIQYLKDYCISII